MFFVKCFFIEWFRCHSCLLRAVWVLVLIEVRGLGLKKIDSWSKPVCKWDSFWHSRAVLIGCCSWCHSPMPFLFVNPASYKTHHLPIFVDSIHPLCVSGYSLSTWSSVVLWNIIVWCFRLTGFRQNGCMAGVRWGAFTCVWWQVILWSHMIWQVTSRSSEMRFPWRAISTFTFTFSTSLGT